MALAPGVLRRMCLLVCLAVPARAHGAETHAIRLQEAVRAALRANPQLAQAVADVAIAEGNLLSARGLDDLSIDASGSFTENRIPSSTVLPTEFDELTGTLALTQPIPTGGKLQLKFSTDYQRTRILSFDEQGRPVQSPPTEVYTPALQLSFQHPVLRGFGVDVARAQRRRALAQRDVATLLREGAAANLLRDVVSAYWELAYASEELAIRRASAASAREQLRVVEANIKVGKQPPSASAEVEVSIALRDEDALFAEQQLCERALELARLCNFEISPEEPLLAAAERPEPTGSLPTLGDALADAARQNPQLAAARAQTRAATIEVDVTDNGLLPQLDVAVAGGPVGSSSDASAAFSRLSGLDSYAVNAGLVFSQAPRRRGAKGAFAAARAGLHKAELSQADIAEQVAAATARLHSAIAIARRRLGVLAPSTEAAALDLAAEKARFEVGRSTNFDVLRRQDEVAQAELRVVRAKADHEKNLAALEALTGTILTRFRVSDYGTEHPTLGQADRQVRQ
jgi:outer membrane protein TolC